MNNSDIVYTIEFEEHAVQDIKALKKSDKVAYKKLQKLLEELREHPTTGTGKPEALRHELSGYYSRRISRKHRLIYSIDEARITVIILAASGHYRE